MNDDEVLGAVRGSLTAVRDSLDGVHMERPVEALVARGRARRVRRTVAIRAAVACGTAAVTAAVLAVTGGASGTPARTGPGGAAQAHPVADVMLRMENARPPGSRDSPGRRGWRAGATAPRRSTES